MQQHVRGAMPGFLSLPPHPVGWGQGDVPRTAAGETLAASPALASPAEHVGFGMGGCSPSTASCCGSLPCAQLSWAAVPRSLPQPHVAPVTPVPWPPRALGAGFPAFLCDLFLGEDAGRAEQCRSHLDLN